MFVFDKFIFIDILIILLYPIITYFLIKKYEKYTIHIVFTVPILLIILSMIVNFKIGLHFFIGFGVAFGFIIFPTMLPKNILEKDIFNSFKKK